jgi:hypothetical protein
LVFIVTAQVTVLVLAHPLHETKVSPSQVAGAISVTEVPGL